jgi:cell division protein FtsW
MPFNRYSHVVICFAVAALVGLGLVMLASTSVWVENEGQQYYHLTRQLIWVFVGLGVACVAAMFDYRNLRRHWPLLLAGACFLLALCYVPGLALVRNGEARWIKVPGIGQFQPSEVAKPVVVIVLAAWFARYQAETRKFWKGFVWPMALLGIPTALIFFEKDMGTAVSVGAAGFAVLFVAGTRLPYLALSSVAGGGMFWYFVQSNENRWHRIVAFMDLEKYQLGVGLQQWRALQAFGSGGIVGRGLGNGAEKHGYLPFAHTDFIFPMIGEELGVWFTLAVVFCFVLIAVFGFLVAIHASDPFGRLLAVGVTAMIVVPAMLNIAVTTAVLPNTGLPLPFVSYGGTNLVFALACAGLLISVHRRSVVLERGVLAFEKVRKQSYAVKM